MILHFPPVTVLSLSKDDQLGLPAGRSVSHLSIVTTVRSGTRLRTSLSILSGIVSGQDRSRDAVTNVFITTVSVTAASNDLLPPVSSVGQFNLTHSLKFCLKSTANFLMLLL